MLVKYEFLKILRKKSTLIVMAISLILTAFLFGLPIIQFQTYHQDGVIKGTEGIAYQKAETEKYSVPLTEDYVTETIKDVCALFENPDNVGTDGNEQLLIGDAYWNNIAPREKLLELIANTYAGPNEYMGYNNLPDVDVADWANFYQSIEEKVENDLEQIRNGNYISKIDRYWTKAEITKSIKEYNSMELDVRVYTFLAEDREEEKRLAYLVKETIDLMKETAEQNLNYLLEEVEQLVASKEEEDVKCQTN